MTDRGDRGVAGERGPKGDHGQPGDKGKQGRPGKDAPVRSDPRVVMTWRLFVWAYLLPMLLFAGALALSYKQLGEQFDRVEELRRERVKDTARTDEIVCARAVTNAQINLSQNARLLSLLEASIAARRARGTRGNGFEQAVTEAQISMAKENAQLQRIIKVDCVGLPSSRPFEQADDG